MTTNVSFRPQVSLAPTVVQQSKANECRENLNKVDKDVRNNQISDISAMTQRMMIESQLRDTKVAPVKYVEKVEPQKWEPAQVGNVSATKPSNVTDVIAKFHRGAQPSKHQQSQVLMDQMNMFAASNMILHGLF